MTTDAADVSPVSPLYALRELLAAFDPDTPKNEQLAALIALCIEEGMDTRPRIIGAMMKLGFTNRHAGKILSDGTNNRWVRSKAGNYINF